MKLNKKKIAYIVREMERGTTSYQISKNMQVSISRVYQIWRNYNKTGILPVVGFQTGRPKEPLPDNKRKLILEEFNETHFSASILEKLIT
jgi:transposase